MAFRPGFFGSVARGRLLLQAEREEILHGKPFWQPVLRDLAAQRLDAAQHLEFRDRCTLGTGEFESAFAFAIPVQMCGLNSRLKCQLPPSSPP
jgi:hypothetical protein